ncbi:hypothetical protein HF086_003186 [Spodoptera exigua]|uniref:DUF7041 domain-containing protein n=1 Tax=Spodoptera exigua TaxID=7107 RepID=A0A922MGC2_SPOEX|nr:hypothetical protein HF086_003186 [Spodoptera exigua]
MAPPVPPSPPTMASDLAAIGLASRVPPFWTDMPKMWFQQFESVMGPQHQSEQVKYDMVVSKLGKEELCQVADLISNPPEQHRYTSLKNKLIKIFEASAEAQFHKLVSEMELGQQRPSQLLTKMNELAKNSAAAGDTVKNLWLSRLPAWVRAILATNKDDTKLDDLAETADKIMDNMRSGELLAINTNTAPGTSTSTASGVTVDLLTEIRNMAVELKTLRDEVSSIGYRRQQVNDNRRWERNRSQSRPRSQRTQRSPSSPDWLCWLISNKGDQMTSQ